MTGITGRLEKQNKLYDEVSLIYDYFPEIYINANSIIAKIAHLYIYVYMYMYYKNVFGVTSDDGDLLFVVNMVSIVELSLLPSCELTALTLTK